MRKSVIIYLLTTAVILSMAAVFPYASESDLAVRYHQHRQRSSEAELGPCGVCDKLGLCTHLPIIEIDTGGRKIPGRPIPGTKDPVLHELCDDGYEDLIVTISTIDANGTYNHPDDAPEHVSQARFRMRGDSSRWFAKPSYRAILVEDGNREQKRDLPLLGMPSGSEWAMHGPFLDKTLVRNYMWMNLSAEIMGYAPNVRFCEVLIDGEYQGLYVLMEMIEMSESRVNLTEYREGDPVNSYLLRIGYFTRASTRAINDFGFYTRRWEESALEVLYPGRRFLDEHVFNYISTDISEFQKRLFSLEMIENTRMYEEHIDKSSFVDHYIIMEFVGETDFFSKSTYLYKDVRGKLHIGPVWDFNNSLNNQRFTAPSRAFLLYDRAWYARLMMDPEFVESVIRRYKSLREGVLSEENLIRYIAETELWLGGAIDRNFAVWGYSFDPGLLTEDEYRTPTADEIEEGLTIYDLNPRNFDEAMDWMIDYMINRGEFMDEYIETLRQHCHPSRRSLWDLT